MQPEKIAELAEENERLKRRVAVLEAQISFLTDHPTFAEGMRGERLVATSLDGTLTSYGAAHDIELPSGTLIEVKSSRLNKPHPNSSTLRWAWSKVLGTKGLKRFDFLLLIGEADVSHRQHYKDPSCPFIFFLVPHAEVRALATQTGSIPGIQLTTNPLKARSTGSALFTRYQMTIQEIKERVTTLPTPQSAR
jgi:hypothetical protein